MKKAGWLLSLLFLVIIGLPGCVEEELEEDITEQAEDSFYLSAWTVYWDDEEVLFEINSLEETLKEVVLFAAYFNEAREVFIPETTTSTYESIKKEVSDSNIIYYLSFVNDLKLDSGGASLKDTELLYELFKDETTIERHINNLITLAIEEGYQGIELDYEGIKGDQQLWEMYLEFIMRLYEKLQENQLNLRVVLEPSIPMDVLSLPTGPDYVVMCYNLYGSHSGPGPKADLHFLEELMGKMSQVPNVTYALATGGFDWGETDTVSLTEKDANDLIEAYAVTPVRDKESQALTFEYKDDQGENHEVWFADGDTLMAWINLLREGENHHFSIWRLNGNREASLDSLTKIE